MCGCGGSDYVSGDRLRVGGDCESAELVQANPRRVRAAVASLATMASFAEGREPNVAQVSNNRIRERRRGEERRGYAWKYLPFKQWVGRNTYPTHTI